MNIVYCHHAQRNRGKIATQNDDITELGKKDAEIVSELLDELQRLKGKVVAIYTAEFLRCTKTAEIINQKIKVPVFVDARLNESRSVEGETWLDSQNRVKEAIVDIINKHEDDEIVVCVTSGTNVAPFICLQFGVELSENTPFVAVPSCSPMMFSYNRAKFKQ